MTQQSDLSLQERNLFQQGFHSYTPSELKSLKWGLRFTPFVCMVVGFYGLITHNIYILFSVSAIGIIAAFFPKKHPFDLIYNHLVRHLFKGVALPPNPLQRRLACLGAGFMNAGISFLFLADPTVHPRTLSEIDLTMAGLGTGGVIAYILGYSLITMQLIVFANHFCLLSWGYEKLMSAMGLLDQPLSAERAKKLLDLDALIIDVRESDAFRHGHIDNAVNVPLEELKNENQLRSFRDRLILIYCENGRYSFIAQELMRKHGNSMAYALGSYDQAKQSLRRI